MRISVSTLLVGAMALGAVGCDGDDQSGPPIEDRAGAERGFNALVGTLGDGTSEVAARMAEFSPEGIRFRAGDLGEAVSVDLDFPCPEGGSAHFDGRLDATGVDLDGNVDLNAPIAVEFELNVSLDGCRADGVTIDGSLEYILDVDVDPNNLGATSVIWTYRGEVEFDGAAVGFCPFDCDTTDDGDSQVATGDVCGFPAADFDIDIDVDL